MKNMSVGTATAIILGEPSERQRYEGRGDSRKPVGRLTDSEGRPVSGIPALANVSVLGVLGDATVLLPDAQAAALKPGAVIQLPDARVSLSGADFGKVRATVSADHAQPVGTLDEALAALAAREKQAQRG